jgi:hypothetical protein
MGLADLHIHTIHSWDGTSSVSGVLKYASDRTNLDVIAITDHDRIEGAFEALELAPLYGIEVIPGCEISTADGHLLALFVRERIRPGMPLVETVLQVAGQGGVCIAAHPQALGASSLSEKTIRQALLVPGVAQALVGIEVFNAGLIHRQSNWAAMRLARSLPLAWTGNSDSHVLKTIGQGATSFPGRTAAELRSALIHRTTSVHAGERQTSGFYIITRWIPLYMLRRAGWVATSSGGQAPLRLSRLTKKRDPYYSTQ